MLEMVPPTGVTTTATSPSFWPPMVNTAMIGRSVEPRLWIAGTRRMTASQPAAIGWPWFRTVLIRVRPSACTSLARRPPVGAQTLIARPSSGSGSWCEKCQDRRLSQRRGFLSAVNSLSRRPRPAQDPRSPQCRGNCRDGPVRVGVYLGCTPSGSGTVDRRPSVRPFRVGWCRGSDSTIVRGPGHSKREPGHCRHGSPWLAGQNASRVPSSSFSTSGKWGGDGLPGSEATPIAQHSTDRRAADPTQTA